MGAHTQNSRSFGKRIEQSVCDYLQKQGMATVEENYSCKLGEIDLIMRDQKDVLVFVEVRYRKQKGYGDGAESVTPAKQRKIIRTAKCYLQQHGLYDKCYCRFDVVAVSDEEPYVRWIKDAFWAY